MKSVTVQSRVNPLYLAGITKYFDKNNLKLTTFSSIIATVVENYHKALVQNGLINPVENVQDALHILQLYKTDSKLKRSIVNALSKESLEITQSEMRVAMAEDPRLKKAIEDMERDV